MYNNDHESNATLLYKVGIETGHHNTALLAAAGTHKFSL